MTPLGRQGSLRVENTHGVSLPRKLQHLQPIVCGGSLRHTFGMKAEAAMSITTALVVDAQSELGARSIWVVSPDVV